MPSTDSILRYPGGKSQLSKYVAHLIKKNDSPRTYIEPFAGGFGIALCLLFNGQVDKVVMNDYDPSIFAVWYAVLNKTEDLIGLIDRTSVTLTEWHTQRSIHEKSYEQPYSIENAFSTLFLNRTNVSGIIQGGPIGGQSQAGKYKIDCRFNKDALKQKIRRIAASKDRIILSNLDAKEFIRTELPNYDSKDTFIFFDPPYFKQGRNLYLSFPSNEEHKILAENIVDLTDYKWITTYDHEEEILNLYRPYVQSFEYNLRYSANQKKMAKEYLFASKLTEIDSYGKVNLTKI